MRGEVQRMTDMSFLPETRKASKICGFAAVTLNTPLPAVEDSLLDFS
jgi:hypothetical protein